MNALSSYELLVGYFENSDLFPNGTEESKKILLTLYKMLARGRPVSIDDLSLVSEVEKSTVEKVIEKLPGSHIEYDTNRAITAYRGLTLTPTGHQLIADGVQLYTWCAFDCLFLSGLLNSQIEVTSKCPQTGEKISISMSQGTVLTASHMDIFVSFVMPEIDVYKSDLQDNFCCHIHFFSSQKAGNDWAESKQNIVCVPLDEACTIAHVRNNSGFGSLR